MLKKGLIVAASLVASTIVFAAPKSSDIHLPDIVIAPQSYQFLEFRGLIPEVEYSVHCAMVSDDLSGQDYDILKPFKSTVNAFINETPTGNMAFRLPAKQSNDLKIDSVYINSALAYINTDDTDTITIRGCVASPVVYG